MHGVRLTQGPAGAPAPSGAPAAALRVQTLPGPPAAPAARFFGQHRVHPDHARPYANLFGIVVAMEAVEGEYLAGRLDDGARERVCAGLRRNLAAVRGALGLSAEQLWAFAGACRVPCAYARAALEAADARPMGLGAGVELGEAFTELADACVLDASDARHYAALVATIAACCAALRADADPAVRAHIERWRAAFAAMQPADRPDGAVVRALRADIDGWRAACIANLTGK
jgi:hypothetical protein